MKLAYAFCRSGECRGIIELILFYMWDESSNNVSVILINLDCIFKTSLIIQMKFIRTFMPVGQGAFYIEKHCFKESDFTVVYDCGSNTLDKKKRDRFIRGSFKKGHQIDVLFISHFHEDHINGIAALKKHCTIKKVIMPFLSEEAKMLVRISSLISGGGQSIELIENPIIYFGDGTQVIQVQAVDLESGQADDIGNVNLETPILLSGERALEPQVRSGSVFTLHSDLEWYYMPFNYLNTTRKNQFEVELSMLGLSLPDLDTIDKILLNKAKIRIAYDKVDGDLNINSMALYSGPYSSRLLAWHSDSYCFCWWWLLEKLESGILYTGDIDLNQPGLLANLLSYLSILTGYIGTIQVPHHGSINNYENGIIQANTKCAVISHGVKNIYGHPSSSVVADLMTQIAKPHSVTENLSTLLTQWD